MFDINTYFSAEKAKTPYQDQKENLADYTSLAWAITDMAVAWRQECGEEECVHPARGIRITEDTQKSIALIQATPYDEREDQLFSADVQDFVREGLDYIVSRESATREQHAEDADVCSHILRVRSMAEAFHLTNRQFILVLLLVAMRGDIRILEACSYVAADNSISEDGAATVGLYDMLLHLIFSYEVIQAEKIADRRSTFARYFINRTKEAENPLREKISIHDHVYRYILFGEKSFTQKPVSSTPGTGIYYEEFAAKFQSYEDARSQSARESEFCYIRAKDTEDTVHVLTKVYEKLGKPLYVIDPDEIRSDNRALFFTLRMAHELNGARVLVKFQSEEEESRKASDKFAEQLTKIISLLKKELPKMATIYLTGSISFPNADVHGADTPSLLTLEKPDIDMRLAMWQDLFLTYGLKEGDDIDLMDIADCHELYFGQIRTVVERCHATLRMTSSGGDVVERKLLQEILFSFSKVDFDYLATPVEAKYTWDDIYLDEPQKVNLKYACDRYRLRNRIGAQWEITKKNAYGNAVIVLMYGPPGTGKTMAAQVVANEVMTPLYRVDVSQIFSKYIGETQKNISRIFEEAQKRNVVLFFDEADALFTKRTEIKDSHDKYANSDTSFLLQKVEEYNGISILATNNYQSFDPAFTRRLTYVIRFDKPDEETRRLMWDSMISEKVPRAADVDLGWLAVTFNDFSGSNIKSIIMTACFMAAADESLLTMRHLIRAVRLEYEKLGRLVDPADFGQYAVWLFD